MPCRQVSQDPRAGSAAKRCARALSPIAVACGSGSKTSPPPIADRCQVSNGGCDRNAICSFAANQVSCTCKDGFLGDGLRCASGDVVVDAATALAPIKRSELGLNMNPFVDLSDARLVPALRQLNASILRFPSGFADDYHWQTNTDCVYTPHPASTFDVFMKNVAGPLGADVVIGVNYGSNASCNGPGDPAEAAAWVDAANNHNKYGPSCWANTTR
jgi:hypothetical protein